MTITKMFTEILFDYRNYSEFYFIFIEKDNDWG